MKARKALLSNLEGVCLNGLLVQDRDCDGVAIALGVHLPIRCASAETEVAGPEVSSRSSIAQKAALSAEIKRRRSFDRALSGASCPDLWAVLA